MLIAGAATRGVQAAPAAGAQIHWHALPAEEAIGALRTRHEGLRQGEARERLARHGPNRLPEPKARGPLARFAAQFNNVLETHRGLTQVKLSKGVSR